MNDDEKVLWQREKNRREALWQLEGLWPGNVASRETIATLESIEQQDRDEPIGPAFALSVEQLKEQVPITELRSFRIVLDDDVPEPWRTRFSEASAGSTRLKEGFYVQDWLKFLSLWQKEMLHVQAHREAWQQLDREEERWGLLQQLKELTPGNPSAKPLLDRLDVIAAEDLPALTLAQVRDSAEPRDVGRWKVIPDRNIPSPWNIRFGLYQGRASRFPEGWYVHDWDDFLDAWQAAQERVEMHRQELGDN
jgi:hypothetical protein